MNAELAHQLDAKTALPTWRVRVVQGLGPSTSLGGIVWALVQPYRITLLHPFGEGFWWLVGGESPLYVVLAGLLFWRVVAIPLAEDLHR